MAEAASLTVIETNPELAIACVLKLLTVTVFAPFPLSDVVLIAPPPVDILLRVFAEPFALTGIAGETVLDVAVDWAGWILRNATPEVDTGILLSAYPTLSRVLFVSSGLERLSAIGATVPAIFTVFVEITCGFVRVVGVFEPAVDASDTENVEIVRSVGSGLNVIG